MTERSSWQWRLVAETITARIWLRGLCHRAINGLATSLHATLLNIIQLLTLLIRTEAMNCISWQNSLRDPVSAYTFANSNGKGRMCVLSVDGR